MKKILIVFLLIFAFGFSECYAQNDILFYQTTEFAYKHVTENYEWSEWSDWEKSSLIITINLNKDVVRVFSPKVQTYKIISNQKITTDKEGGIQNIFNFVDQDGDYGTMRLRIEINGNSQMYIEFANIKWVYNLHKINDFEDEEI